MTTLCDDISKKETMAFSPAIGIPLAKMASLSCAPFIDGGISNNGVKFIP